MVIRSTSALEAIIQAVSPEFSGSGGGAAAKAAFAVASQRGASPPPRPQTDAFKVLKFALLLKLP